MPKTQPEPRPGAVILLAVAALSLVVPAAGDGAPCPYATWTVDHGTWYSGMSQECYCDNGDWKDCKPTEYAAGLAGPGSGGGAPVYGQCLQNGIQYPAQSIQMIDGRTCTCIGSSWQCDTADAGCYDGNNQQVPHGQWFTQWNGQQCYCDNGTPGSCYSNSPPPPATCWDADKNQKVSQGQWFTNWAGKTCYCSNGSGTNCYAQASPPPPAYYSGCYDAKEDKQVSHGQWFTNYSGKTCYCNDGSGSLCKDPTPEGCYYDGYWVGNGQWIDTATQRCRCQDGQLKFCKDLCQAGKMQLAFIFDTSTSLTEDDDDKSKSEIGEQNWDAMRKFTSQVVEEVPIGYSEVVVSYTNFDDDIDTLISFTDPESANKNELLWSLYNWKPEIKGNTFLGAAMTQVFNLYQGYDSARVMVILTDGDADDNIQAISSLLEAQDVIIYAVGIGNVEYDQLKVLTGGNTNRILYVDDFDELSDNIDFLRDAVCQNYGY